MNESSFYPHNLQHFFCFAVSLIFAFMAGWSLKVVLICIYLILIGKSVFWDSFNYFSSFWEVFVQVAVSFFWVIFIIFAFWVQQPFWILILCQKKCSQQRFPPIPWVSYTPVWRCHKLFRNILFSWISTYQMVTLFFRQVDSYSKTPFLYRCHGRTACVFF